MERADVGTGGEQDARTSGRQEPGWRVVWWGGVGLMVGWVLARHVARYFFVFDDFALVGVARRNSVADIVLGAPFGFYRPLTFLLVKLQAWGFGWERPWGYALVSTLLHIANAALWGRLLRGRGWSVGAATSASLLMLWSPWAGETFFWVACQFDLWATWLMLLSLGAMQRSERPGPLAGRALWWGLGLLATLAAQFSKEIAVILPVLYAALLVSGPRWRPSAGQIARCVALGTVVLGAVAWRGRFLHGLGGAYGDLGMLMRQANLQGNLKTYVQSFGMVPFDVAWPAFRGIAALQTLGVMALALAALRFPRRAVLLLGGFGLCLAPVIWTGVGMRITGGGRLLYAPSLLAVAALALALETPEAGPRQARLLKVARGLGLAGLLVTCALSLVSDRYQMRVWNAATAMARSVVAQVEPYLDAPALYLPNLPSLFEQGPYVLKPYAFEYYYEGRRVPPVRAGEVRLRYARSRVTVVPWSDEDAKEAPAGEVTVTLDLQLPSER